MKKYWIKIKKNIKIFILDNIILNRLWEIILCTRAIYSSILVRLNNIIRQENDSDSIKVGFVVQRVQMWNKQQPIFEKMMKDKRFDPYLIIVPAYDIRTYRLQSYGEELEYFSKLYDSKYILTTKELGENFSHIEKGMFEYIFLPQCWEKYLPKNLYTKSLMKKTKTIYVPYCFHLVNSVSSYYKMNFFNYCYLVFASNNDQLKKMNKYGYYRVVYKGFPSVEVMLNKGHKKENSKFTVLYTPRWTVSDEYGGTSFLDYKDNIIEFAKKNVDIQVIIRPHPLMWDNILRDGVLTEAEIEKFKEQCFNVGIIIDENKNVDDTLEKIDVLLTDYSSIIVDSYVLGTPIIYTKSVPNIEAYQPFKNIIDTMYYTENWMEIDTIIHSICDGNDYLEAARKGVIDCIYRDNENSTGKILDYLASDMGLIR